MKPDIIEDIDMDDLKSDSDVVRGDIEQSVRNLIEGKYKKGWDIDLCSFYEPVYKPEDRDEFASLVMTSINAFGSECSLNWIDTSEITNMSALFCNSDFNGDISKWNVSKVTDMSWMFYGSKFKGDISEWDVSSVQDMSFMFSKSQFNGDLSHWDVSKVKSFKGMFWESWFNRDISSWKIADKLFQI